MCCDRGTVVSAVLALVNPRGSAKLMWCRDEFSTKCFLKNACSPRVERCVLHKLGRPRYLPSLWWVMVSVILLSLVLLDLGLIFEFPKFFNIHELGSSLTEFVHISSWLYS